LTDVTIPSTTSFLNGLKTIALYTILNSAKPLVGCNIPLEIEEISITEIMKPNLPEHVPSTSSCKRLIKHAWIFGPKYCGWSKIVWVKVFYL